MSAPSDQPLDSTDPLAYAPKRIHEAAKRAQLRLELMAPKGAAKPVPAEDSDDDSVKIPFFLNASPSSENPSLSPPSPAPRKIWGLRAPVIAGIGLLALGGALAIWTAKASKYESASIGASPWADPPKRLGTKLVELRRDDPNPKLNVVAAAPRLKGDPSPLGVSVGDLKGGGFIVVRGLAAGASLTAGDSAGDRTWWLSASRLSDAAIVPPAQFVGSMEITVELRLADTSLSDQRSLRFEWTEPQEQKPVAAALKPAPQSPPARQLPAEESAALVQRGEDLIASGDLAAARLVLRRAAESEDARAALLLAKTYDAATIEKLHARGLSPDADMARYWHEKAAALGARDARGKPKKLADKPE